MKLYKKISANDIERVQNELKEHPVYSLDDKLVKDILKLYPNHSCDSVYIAAKIAIINVANSTQLEKHKKVISMYDLANRIKKIKDIDNRLDAGDKTLVTEIANLYGKPRLTSLASKYCMLHNRYVYKKDLLVKYDDLVRRGLPDYVNVKVTHMGHNYDLYYDKIQEVIDYNNLGHIKNIREKLDQYIWWTKKQKQV